MELLNFIWFILYGFTAGVLAKIFLPGRDCGGFITTVLLGICGSLVGGVTFSLFEWEIKKSFSLEGLIPAFTGAVVILIVYNIVQKKLR